MKVKDIIGVIEDFAPLSLQEEYDNSGLIIGDREQSVSTVIITIDVTDEVVNEAIEKGAELIISHHPLIFNPIRTINTDNLQGELLIKIIRNNVSIYAAHTNVDKADENIARELGEKLNLEDLCPLADQPAIYGSLHKPCTFAELISKVSAVTGDTTVKSIGNYDDVVEEICIANGACGNDENLLVQAGTVCDAFITSEVKYHIALKAKQMGINVIEIGHYESEKEFINLIYGKLEKNKEIKVVRSDNGISPYNK